MPTRHSPPGRRSRSSSCPSRFRGTQLGLEVLEDRIVLSSSTSTSSTLLTTAASNATTDSLVRPAAIPNDTRFGEQWDLRNTGQVGGKAGADIHTSQAWDVTTGSTRTVVAVMDTGVDY